MSRCLVVCYSWTGHTATVARAIAEALSAEVEEIREVRRRGGLFAFLRSGMEASRKQGAPIQRCGRNLADYDLVILGSPVWAGSMASPVRSFIAQERGSIRRLALFCTVGNVGGDSAMTEMAELCRLPPVATLEVKAGTLKSGGWTAAVEQFAARIRQTLDPATA